MDRSSFLRTALFGLAIFVFVQWVMPGLTGKRDGGQKLDVEVYANGPQFSPDKIDPMSPGDAPRETPDEGDECTLDAKLFRAEFSGRGAGLRHFWLKDPKYVGSEVGDLATTPDVERWRSFRTLFRSSSANDQMRFDRVMWKREAENSGACRFSYEDGDVRLVKTFTAGQRPFEVLVKTEVTNRQDAPRRHQLTMATFAFRTNKEMKGGMGRVSPFVSELSCATGSKVERKTKEDFRDGWFNLPDTGRFAAVSNYYFAQALVPSRQEPLPICRLLAEDWFSAGQKRDDEDAATVFHAELVYPAKELQPGETTTYNQTAFFGPKDRDILRTAAGDQAGLGDLINLGFFSPVARVLVTALTTLYGVTTNWGVAIVLLTLGLRTLLFPLTWRAIKTTVAMRRLKPELDALNAKFPDDPQSRNLAMMELYRKNNVNPFGGCLPQLIQMPVWFAMYTTLQTAVEMYHAKFLWFTDLSAPDKFYVLPLVLGAFMIVQQRIVPQQGMDPVQQKMMTYMLPAIFTVMMLFLPAALGIYMLTNSVLGIAQQLGIEKFAPREPLTTTASTVGNRA